MKILNREIDEVVSLMRKEHDAKETARFEAFKKSSEVHRVAQKVNAVLKYAKGLPKDVTKDLLGYHVNEKTTPSQIQSFVAHRIFDKKNFDRRSAQTKVTLTAASCKNMTDLLSKLKLKI